LAGSQRLKINVKLEKFTPFTAPSINCSTKEKKSKIG
jgi:hypothetical protein